MEIRIAVCDDEKPIRDELIRWIREYVSYAIIRDFSCGEDLLTSPDAYDIIFLDIEMKGVANGGNRGERLSGMDTAKLLRDRSEGTTDTIPILIFVTGYSDYMSEAFDVEAFHYLVKPVEQSRFIEILERAIKKLDSPSQIQNDTLIIKSKGLSICVQADDILFIESDRKKIQVHTKSDVIESYSKIADMQSCLDDRFYRCHRCYLINLKNVTSYRSEEVFFENSSVPIAQKKYQEFLTAYTRFLRSSSSQPRHPCPGKTYLLSSMTTSSLRKGGR